MGSEQTRHGHGHIERIISVSASVFRKSAGKLHVQLWKLNSSSRSSCFHKTGITLLAWDPVKVQAVSCGA